MEVDTGENNSPILEYENYEEQVKIWPEFGQCILAQYTDEYVVVYQAYKKEIGEYAAKHKTFIGSEYSLSRMSWIKTNFLWMMYRSGWGIKHNQEVTLALFLKRDFFGEILNASVESSYDPDVYASKNEYQVALKSSIVRRQWDPDHSPNGSKERRRAIQLGLKGEILKKFASGEGLIDIQDISEFVDSQYNTVQSGATNILITPKERELMLEEQLSKKVGIKR